MLNIIPTTPPSLQRFLGNFKDLFIKPQFKNFKVYPLDLQLELKRTNIQTIDECRPKSNYDSLHHFLTNSPWDEEKVNSRRTEIIQKDNRTRSRPDGALVIDDVACEKSKSATKIEAAKVQYPRSEKGLINCNVVVTCYFIMQTRQRISLLIFLLMYPLMNLKKEKILQISLPKSSLAKN